MKKMYGAIFYLTDPHPSKLMIREVKKSCVDSIKKSQVAYGGVASRIKFFQINGHEIIDPETGQKKFVSTYGWKAFIG